MNKQSEGLYALYLDHQWLLNLQKGFFKTDKFLLFSENITTSFELYEEFISLCKLLFSDALSLKKEEVLFEFISKLILEHCEEQEVLPQDLLFCDIKKYIDINKENTLSLEQIAKQFLITPFHLIRVFKQKLKLTPHQYILSQKIEYAKELLSTDISISAVALAAGFTDQSHLYKYFKQIYSITPNEYKSSLKY